MPDTPPTSSRQSEPSSKRGCVQDPIGVPEADSGLQTADHLPFDPKNTPRPRPPNMLAAIYPNSPCQLLAHFANRKKRRLSPIRKHVDLNSLVKPVYMKTEAQSESALPENVQNLSARLKEISKFSTAILPPVAKDVFKDMGQEKWPEHCFGPSSEGENEVTIRDILQELQRITTSTAFCTKEDASEAGWN